MAIRYKFLVAASSLRAPLQLNPERVRQCHCQILVDSNHTVLSDGPNGILEGTLEGFHHESRDQRDRARETRLAMHKDAGFGVYSTDIL